MSPPELFTRHEALALAVASRVKRRAGAHVQLQDLQQAARLGLLEASRAWSEADGEFLQFAGRAILRRTRQCSRMQRRLGDPPDESIWFYAETPDLLSQQQELMQLAVAIGFLPDRERDIVSLRFDRNLTLAEIGSKLGISKVRAKELLDRALEILRAQI